MNIKYKIENWIREILGIEEELALVHPTLIQNGDFSLIVSENAKEYTEKLKEHKLPEIEKIELVEPRFINFYLSKEFFGESVKEASKEDSKEEDKYGNTKLLEGKKYFIEHTQPNPFKEFHIGHLMNNTIGESIARIVKATGGEVKTATYHGDVGMHIAKAIYTIYRKNLPVTTETMALAYAEGNKAFEDSDEAKKEITEINKKIYDKSDEKINKIYEEGRQVSLDYFESIYKKLGSNFDFHFYESEAGKVGKKLVEENKGKVFEESEGAVVFKGENFEPKTHTRVFLNSDGLPTYETKELGLAKIKKEKFEYDESITVTANEQDAFFDVVEVAIGEVFPELKGKLKHISHGILKLPSGKMSSRTGTIISAESLIDQVREKVLEKIKDRDFDDEEKENVAEVVAIGAIKYSILRQAVGGDIIFDFDKSISFEGDSGPYLQYAYTRARSVILKAESQKVKSGNEVPENWKTTDLERYLYRFPEVSERVVKEFSPHHLVTYLTEIAGAFNSFYGNKKIVDENDPASPYKISLTFAAAQVLKNGLNLLGIKTLEKM